ncbi:MAG: hypothetical protein HY695_20550 [Deltaproteobacteria bacterium]|nr:hypothetical protein [Deltaproteobacteria bacterium]
MDAERRRPEKFSGITFSRVIVFPDGDIQVSGSHCPPPGKRGRPRATPEELAKKANDRARREIRTVSKYFGLCYLWTLTYRGPRRDRKACFQDVTQWLRLVRRVYPEFKCLGAFELHQGGGVNDGGIHVHLGVNEFYDVSFLRRCWWSVVGEKQGNVQVEGPNQCGYGGRSSPRDVARYLCKYISKEFEGSTRLAGEHRYFRSRGIEVPTERKIFFGCNFTEHEFALLEWMKTRTDKKISIWRSENGLQFMFCTFP